MEITFEKVNGVVYFHFYSKLYSGVLFLEFSQRLSFCFSLIIDYKDVIHISKIYDYLVSY